ncbi:MAG TPA: DsbA family protein [Gammaproteobacteria bacterium]|nr:DsbA family protein [Gammaproteobacteria bacterium]
MRKLVRMAVAAVLFAGCSSAFAATSDLNKLYRAAGNTVAGNPDGHITIVEFFDYNCGYCRLIYPRLNKLLQADHDIRLVYREYPVLSPHSMLPAQAALAAQNQGKYLQLHTAMMEASMPLFEGEINRLAAEQGINTSQLDKDMNSPDVMKQVQTNLSVGQALNIQGVPSFIVVRTTPPSSEKANVLVGPSLRDLKEAIQQAEASK